MRALTMDRRNNRRHVLAALGLLPENPRHQAGQVMATGHEAEVEDRPPDVSGLTLATAVPPTPTYPPNSHWFVLSQDALDDVTAFLY